MAFDPTDKQDMTRLRSCIRESQQLLRPFWNNRKVLLKALHDPCHETDVVNAEDREPHNPLDRMFRIITRAVVSQSPSLRIVHSKNPRHSGMLRAQLSSWIKRANFADTLYGMFQEAMLRWGIVFTGHDTYDDGYGMEPWATVIDFDDYFIDQRGNEEEEIDFEGHDYARRLKTIQQSAVNDPTYDLNVVDRMTETSANRYNGGGKQKTLYEWVNLKCVWLPEEKVELVLVAGEKQVGGTIWEPLRIKPYVGPPDMGPYVRLNLGTVRGTLIPVSRASMLFDLHAFVVSAYRQLYVQADDFLEFYGYSGEAEKDAEKHRTAYHSEYVRFDNPNSVVKYTKGGVSPQLMGTAIHADELFNSDAGNLNLLGGLGPSAPTARQESGLGAGVQGMVDDARQRTDKATKKILDIAAWYITRDAFRGRQNQYDQSPYRKQEMVEWNTPDGLRVNSEWFSDEMADMNLHDEQWEIIPGSMVHKSAEVQLAGLVQAVDTIGRTMALPGEKPEIFKHRRFRELYSEYDNKPELAELFGEAPNQAAVAPGVEAAAQFGQQRGGGRPQGPAPAGQDKTVQRMVFSGAGAQNGQAPA